LVIYLTSGQTADIKCAIVLSTCLRRTKYLLADKAYYADHLGGSFEGAVHPANHSQQVRQDAADRFNKARNRRRNVIERMFGRRKDFRHITTRFNKKTHNFLTALCLAALTADLYGGVMMGSEIPSNAMI
jgi:transposase